MYNTLSAFVGVQYSVNPYVIFFNMGSSTFHISYLCMPFKIPRLKQCTSIMLEILLCFVFRTYWLIYDIPDDDDERSKDVEGVIVKLHVDIVHLVAYSQIFYIYIL
jgi:hypothetical protein